MRIKTEKFLHLVGDLFELKLEILQLLFTVFITTITYINSARVRSRWPRGIRPRSAAARLLRLWVRLPPGCLEVCCECYVLSGRRLCDELIVRPEESYRVRCVVLCDLEISRMKRPWSALGRSLMGGTVQVCHGTAISLGALLYRLLSKFQY